MESYTYDPAGNLMCKTVAGRTTRYEYDAANQLTAQVTDAGTDGEKRLTYAYDGAGRIIREGKREYRCGGMDKVTAMLDAGPTVAEYACGADGQLAGVTRRNGDNERLYWSGPALTRRDYLDGDKVASSERYLNEPHATGGNPVLAWNGDDARAAATRLLFNDMLGSTVAVLDGDKAQATGMTLFGESADGTGFFTGKPHVDELGYAFLFRNYRPEKAKWQTADPLGYPDGWNQLAYCGNGVISCYDFLGGSWGDVLSDLYDTVTNIDKMDLQAKLLFEWWMHGDGVEVCTVHGRPNYNVLLDLVFRNYMKSNRMLHMGVWNWLWENDAISRTTSDLAYSAEIKSFAIQNGYLTGYGLLHGVNAAVGGLQLSGKVTVSPLDGGKQQIHYDLDLIWNDIIDPNGEYILDWVSSLPLKIFGNPKDYIVRLQWSDSFSFITKVAE